MVTGTSAMATVEVMSMAATTGMAPAMNTTTIMAALDTFMRRLVLAKLSPSASP
ncbi:MAG: hypothetical protein E7A86_21805 [Bradyrhizobium sp.]|nr:hypothetical protein [Bradyrhizobium sp.]